MVTKTTRDVMDMTTRPVTDFVLDGTGVSSIDSTPIGATVPDTGAFTTLSSSALTVTTNADFTGATVSGLQSYYADLAEYYESDMELSAGDVIKLGGAKEITKTTKIGDYDVFGVISTAPSYVMNQPSTDGLHYPVVLVGRVPCRVKGAIKKGERLVAGPDGIARAHHIGDSNGLVFARALSSADIAPNDIAMIEVAIVTVK